MLAHHFLENSAARHPDKTALIADEQRLTYRQINEAADRVASKLIAMGLRRREQVILFLENSPEAVISLFAVLKAGGVFVLLNPGMKAGKLSYIINDCAAAALVTHRSKAPIVREALEKAPTVRSVLWCGKGAGLSAAEMVAGRTCAFWSDVDSGACAPPSRVSSIDVDLTTLIYTSGSTGEPKGVMSNHQNMVAATSSITAYLENCEDDIILSALPLSFGYGLYQVLATFFTGGTLVLERSFAFPYRIMERMVEERVTGSPFVPTMIALLLQMDLSHFDLRSLRYVTNAGAALPVPYIRRFRELFPQVRLFSMYGLTECTRALYLPPEEIDRRPDSVGIPIPNEEVFLMNEKGEEVADGSVGELVIRGSHVAQGYWKSPELTARVFRPGGYRSETYLYSGDLFRRDAQGYFYFVSRKDDLIKTKGERVSPREIEDVLCAMEGVAEAAVVGVPDEILGQAIRAFVVPVEGCELSVEEVLRHCLHHLEPFMVPKYVEVRDVLPKSSSGKLDRRALGGVQRDGMGGILNAATPDGAGAGEIPLVKIRGIWT